MSQRREMFRLDAASMGLTASKSNSSFSEDQNECKCNQQQQEEEQEQEQSSATSSCVDEKKRAQPSLFSHSAECPKKQQQQQKQQADAPHSLTSPDSFCRSNMEPVPTEHYRKQLEKLRGICGDASLINFELNGIFLKRLEEIDDLGQQAGDSSSQLRLVTFQDWVDLLLHVNFIIFNNMSNMESESYAKIMNCFQSVRGEQQQVLEENRKLRKDICAIIKLVQEAFHHNNWCTDDMRLETLSVTQLLGIQDTDGRRPESETEKVNKCMKSLASEVAAKHDEICQLQSQLVALDEVVQTARQKLLLKDQCIAQLNQQMAELQSCVSRMSKESGKSPSTLAEGDKGSHLELANAGTLSCLFEGLNEKDQQASELLRMLNKELTEFIDLISKKDYQAMECRRKLISCFFERINSERAETQRHLDNLRSQLQYLNCNVDRLDPPAASSTQIEVEADALLIETLRRRMLNLNECNKELNIKCQRLDAQYKVKLLEVQYTYEAERSINQKNCLALKEIADLLSKLRSADLSYEDIYDDTSTNNPFCTAIMEMYERLNELENSKEGEDLLMAPSDSDTKIPIEPIETTTTKTTTKH